MSDKLKPKKTKPRKSQAKKEFRQRKLLRRLADGEQARKRRQLQKKEVS